MLVSAAAVSTLAGYMAFNAVNAGAVYHSQLVSILNRSGVYSIDIMIFTCYH